MTQDPASKADASSSSSLTDAMARQRAWAQRVAELRPGNKDALFEALAAAGIAHVEIHYEGDDGFGQLEPPQARGPDGNAKPLAGMLTFHHPADDGASDAEPAMPVAEALELLATDLLDEIHPGWESGGGACGVFTFDVAARAIGLKHHQWIADPIQYQHSFRRAGASRHLRRIMPRSAGFACAILYAALVAD